MQLTPRYDHPSFLRLELPLEEPAVPLLRQRRRLEALVSGFGDEQWAAASRCEGWSVRDVVSHLVSTNQFWALSIGSALAGDPTRLLTTFDPVTSPDELVRAARSTSSMEVLDAFARSNAALADAVAELAPEDWTRPGEAPPGHVPLAGVVLHALWDSWVHERDVVLPLGLDPVEEPDEVLGCLAYGAALGPLFGVAGGDPRQGAVSIEATDPDVSLVVEVGDPVVVREGDAPPGSLLLTGPAVELLEALSFRVPFPTAVPEDRRWLLGGLARVFDHPT